MSALPPRAKATSSIRTRFLLVVFFGAVVPLALIGVWLTRSVVRAGEELLHTELDHSLQKVADAISERWSYRSGDLALLAANDVAQRLLSSGVPSINAADSAYLHQLFATLSQGIPSFEYRDPSGVLRWSTPVIPPDTTTTPGSRARPVAPGPTLTITLPVMTSPGSAALGTMIAHVSVASLMPADSALRLPNGAKLQIEQREPHADMLPAFAPDSLLALDRFTSDDQDWLGVHRALADPAVKLHLAAPLAAYVLPFERAAQTGLMTVAIVALLALLFTAFLITRLTRSLMQLAVAADAVAAGDLEHRVDAGGSDEVARVGAAFNSMIDNLRRILGELSKRQALAAVGEYAASLSHQVRNGLTAVRIDLQRAEEKTAPDAPERPLIARALENVKRLDDTVSTSLRAGRESRAPHRRIDIRPILRSVARSAEGAFAEHGATLGPAPELARAAWLLGDAVALEQLFLNLLLNAAQALDRGGRADLSATVVGAELLVVVTDTGRGISAEDLEHVLDPFFSTKSDGTGLGLSIARQVAMVHGGSLRIESEIGRGTTVEVRLPLAAAPSTRGS